MLINYNVFYQFKNRIHFNYFIPFSFRRDFVQVTQNEGEIAMPKDLKKAGPKNTVFLLDAPHFKKVAGASKLEFNFYFQSK